ncbi:putative reverse transcriptase domain-containing protein, partial [Tanacetum coccineum]
VAFPAVEHAPSTEKTESFETDESAATPPPHPVYRVTARISIRDEPPTPFWSDTEVVRLLAIPTPPPSPLSPWSSPLPQIPSPLLPLILSPLPVSPPLPLSPPPLPVSPTYPLGYRAAMIRLRAEAPSTSHSPPPHIILSHTKADTPPSGTPPLLPVPAPTSSLSLLLPSADHGAYEVGESSSAPTARPPEGFRADYGFVATIDREIMWDLERDAGYEITNTWEEMLVDMPGAPANDDTEESEAHARTALLMERERLGCLERLGDDLWTLASDRRRQAAITELLAADHRRHAQFIKALKLLKALQTRMTAFQRQQGPAKGLTQPNESGEARQLLTKERYVALVARDANISTNGDDNHVSGTGVRRTERVARECTYPDFMKCQPLNFKGTKGVIELIQWFKKMETVFSISNCSVENQIKFSTCTLLAGALTWWNSHVKTVGHNVAYAMTWTDLKKKMTDKYCLRVEIKKLEAELWNLKVKESEKIERCVGGLPDMIHGSVVASKPKTMQEAIEIETKLMDKKIRTFAERQTENKRKQDDNHQQPQQQQNKRLDNGRAYTVGSGEKKPYEGSKPLCAKCNYHHDGPCAPKCHKCNQVGHLARDCRSTANANTANNQRGTGAVKVYAVGRAETNPDSNVVTGTFLLNNRYASVLFDTGADRSFVSTAFSSQIDITPCRIPISLHNIYIIHESTRK